MPTDIVELCIAACCIAGMVLVRSPLLAPRDGLDRAARAVTTGMASTVMLVIANGVAYLLSANLSTYGPLAPSTMATTAPLIVMMVAIIVVMLGITVAKKIHAALHQLLRSLIFAIACTTLLLGAVTALLAPAQNIFHAALTAVGAGFGFTLLLRLCAAIITLLDNALKNNTALSTSSVRAASSAQTQNQWQKMLRRIADNSPALTLLLASVLAMLGTAYATR